MKVKLLSPRRAAINIVYTSIFKSRVGHPFRARSNAWSFFWIVAIAVLIAISFALFNSAFYSLGAYRSSDNKHCLTWYSPIRTIYPQCDWPVCWTYPPSVFRQTGARYSRMHSTTATIRNRRPCMFATFSGIYSKYPLKFTLTSIFTHGYSNTDLDANNIVFSVIGNGDCLRLAVRQVQFNNL